METVFANRGHLKAFVGKLRIPLRDGDSAWRAVDMPHGSVGKLRIPLRDGDGALSGPLYKEPPVGKLRIPLRDGDVESVCYFLTLILGRKGWNPSKGWGWVAVWRLSQVRPPGFQFRPAVQVTTLCR